MQHRQAGSGRGRVVFSGVPSLQEQRCPYFSPRKCVTASTSRTLPASRAIIRPTSPLTPPSSSIPPLPSVSRVAGHHNWSQVVAELRIPISQPHAVTPVRQGCRMPTMQTDTSASGKHRGAMPHLRGTKQ